MARAAPARPRSLPFSAKAPLVFVEAAALPVPDLEAEDVPEEDLVVPDEKAALFAEETEDALAAWALPVEVPTAVDL